MANKVLIFKAQQVGLKRHNDNTVTLSYRTTDEIDNAGFAEADKYHRRVGMVMFSEDKIQEADIPTSTAQPGHDSPSQKLRKALYAKWIDGEKTEEFVDYYERIMGELIRKVTSK